VRGVGEERAQPVLARLALGERPLQALEHRVQRQAQPADLRARCCRAHPVGHVAAGDRPRRLPHALERAQAQPHQEPGEQPEREQHTADHERLHQEQAVEDLVNLAERHGDDGHAHAGEARRRQHAVTQAGVALRGHGGQLAGLDVTRNAGGRQLALAVGEDHRAADGLAASVSHLAVGSGRQVHGTVPGWPAAAGRPVGVAGNRHPLLLELVLDSAAGAVGLLVHAVEQERALLRVRHAGEQHEANRGEHEQSGDQARAQRHAQARGARSA
jgi:hypothetical protein